MEAACGPSGVHWSELLEELLALILDKLNLMDHIRFSSVCKQWRLVAADSTTMKKSICLVHTDAPQCLLHRLLLRSFCTSRQDIRIVGGFEAWLVLQRGFELILFNPSSGEAPIILPPLFDNSELWWYTNAKKVILSSEPGSSTGQCTIVLKDSDGRLFFCVLGDTAWTLIYESSIWDIAFYRNKLYLIDDNGVVKVFDSGLYSSPTISTTFTLNQGYLVNASDKLLVIGIRYNRRQFRRNGCHVPWSPYKLTHMKVYVLDHVNLGCVEVESLGDNILFFNPIFSIYSSAQDHPEFSSNHLYFTKSKTTGGYTSVGGYSLDDKALVTSSNTSNGSLVFFILFGPFNHGVQSLPFNHGVQTPIPTDTELWSD